MREERSSSATQTGCRQADGTLYDSLLVFSSLSYRCFRFTLYQPLRERSLTFFAFIVGENVRQDAPSSELKFVRKMQTLVKPMA